MNLSRKKNSVSRVEAGNTVILGLYAIKILCVCVCLVTVLKLLKEGADLNTVLTSGGSLLHLV